MLSIFALMIVAAVPVSVQQDAGEVLQTSLRTQPTYQIAWRTASGQPEALPAQPQSTTVTVDLSDRTKAALAEGLQFDDIQDWIARVDGRVDRLVSLSVWVRNGSPGPTGRAGLRGSYGGGAPTRSGAPTNEGVLPSTKGAYGGGAGGAVLLFRRPPVDGAPSSTSLITSRQVRQGAALSAGELFGGGRPPASDRDVRDWTAASVRAAMPRGIDWSLYAALFVVAVPVGLQEDSQVRPLVVLVPLR